MGTKSPTRFFPFLFGLWIKVTHLDYKNPRHGTTPGREPSCTRMWPHENNIQRRWGVCSGLGAIQYLSLPITIFLGMWLVRLKKLNHHYHTLRPYPFSLNRRGITSTTTPPVSLIVAVCSRHSTPIILASDRKSLDFYRTISLAN